MVENKSHTSINIDTDIIKEIDKLSGTKTDIINRILKEHFFGERILKNRLKLLKDEVKSLEKRLKIIKKQKEDKINNITRNMRRRLEKDKDKIKAYPNLKKTRLAIFNSDFKCNYSLKEYTKLLNKIE